MEENFNSNYPSDLQPFVNSSKFKLEASYEIGRDSRSYGRLAPLLLAAILEPSESLDFKAYCINFCSGNESCIEPACSMDHDTTEIEAIIQSWVKACGIHESKPGRTFRRCIIIGFTSEWESGDKRPEAQFLGHAITLGMEIKDRVLTFKIFDYRMHEYMYNVHDRLFQFMTDAATPYVKFYDSLKLETVCLKGKLHVDTLFMTCMSVAFRVCVHFSRDVEIFESDADFTADSLSLQRHIFRMFSWAKTHPQLKANEKTVLISPAMAQPFFEINTDNCFLMMAPYNLNHSLDPTRDNALAIVNYVNSLKDTIRLRYSTAQGFTATKD